MQGNDPQPHRHQVVELPPPLPHVTEYQQQRLVCAHCGIPASWGALPKGIPTTGYGPRFTSIVALCSGAYRIQQEDDRPFQSRSMGDSELSGRSVRLEQVVRRAVQEPVDEVRDSIQWSDTNVDETRWRGRASAGAGWTVVTQQASVYADSRLREAPSPARVVREGTSLGTIGSDQAKAYDCYPPRQRQLCAASAYINIRLSQAMIDGGSPGQKAVFRRTLLRTCQRALCLAALVA